MIRAATRQISALVALLAECQIDIMQENTSRKTNRCPVVFPEFLKNI